MSTLTDDQKRAKIAESLGFRFEMRLRRLVLYGEEAASQEAQEARPIREPVQGLRREVRTSLLFLSAEIQTRMTIPNNYARASNHPKEAVYRVPSKFKPVPLPPVPKPKKRK